MPRDARRVARVEGVDAERRDRLVRVRVGVRVRVRVGVTVKVEARVRVLDESGGYLGRLRVGDAEQVVGLVGGEVRDEELE